MAGKRTDITIPTNIDPETRRVFLQLLERVRELEGKVVTEDQLVQKGVLKRVGGTTVAMVAPSK